MSIQGSAQWSGRTDGTPWMLRTLVVLLRRLDVRVLYGVMAVVVIFYIIFRPRGTKAQYHLLRHRLGFSPMKACLGVYRNHYTFGQVILDRFACYAGKKYRIVAQGDEIMERWMASEQGFVVLSSHIGNNEMAGYSINRHDKTMYVVAYGGEKQTVTDYRRSMFSKANISLITLKGDDMSHVFVIHDALTRGDVVTLSGDRVFGSEKTLTVNVLGAPARIPAGPFAVATAEGIKVMTLFVMKDSCDTYHLYFRPLNSIAKAGANRRESMQKLADEYAEALSAMTRKYPYQWFHYYDFFA